MRTSDYVQTVTYWDAPIDDGWGNSTFGAPVLLKCRWQESSEMFLDSEGVEVVSKAKVWVKAPVSLGGYLFLGESSEVRPQNLDGAYIIRQYREVPDLRAMFIERIALL